MEPKTKNGLNFITAAFAPRFLSRESFAAAAMMADWRTSARASLGTSSKVSAASIFAASNSIRWSRIEGCAPTTFSVSVSRVVVQAKDRQK